MSKAKPYSGWFGFIAAAAFLIRITGLTGESLWIDEMYTIQISTQPLWDVFWTYDVHPPTYTLLMHPIFKMFGVSEFSLRFPSVIFGLLGLIIIYRIAKSLFDRQTALLAAVIVSLSTFHLAYSQEGRSYVLLMFVAGLSVYLFLKVLYKGRRRYWIGYVIATSLLLYIHNFGAFVVVFQNGWFLIFWILDGHNRKRRLGLWIASQVMILIIYLPWGITVVEQSRLLKDEFWIEKPTPRTLLETLRSYAGGFGLLILAAVSCACSTYGAWIRKDRRQLLSVAFLFCWLIISLAAPYQLSRVSTPVFYARYTIASFIPFSILAAFGLSKLGIKWMRLAAVGAMLLLSVLSIVHYYGHTRKDDWRSAAAYVDALAKPGDHVLIHLSGHEVFQYYSERDQEYRVDVFPTRSSLLLTESAKKITSKNIGLLEETVGQNKRVWLILAHPKDPDHLLTKTLGESRRLMTSKMFYKIEVKLFER